MATHPCPPTDRGWVAAGDLRPGERVVTLPNADGSAAASATATVAWVHIVPGAGEMDNLTVAQDHTYAVGASRAVVHNSEWCGPTRDPQSIGFTQDTISSGGKGYTVEGNIARLKADPNWDIPDQAGNVNPIRIFLKTEASDGQTMKVTIRGRTYEGSGDNLMNGSWYSIDNRRLYAYQKAGRASIPVIEITEQEAMQDMFKWSTNSWGIDPPIVQP